MENCDVGITATPEQLEILAGPKTLESLKVADFLGRQDYINEWIKDWLRQDTGPPDLPLCVENTLLCYKRMFRLYTKATVRALAIGNTAWMASHDIVPLERIWKYVDYQTIHFDMFFFLCHQQFPPFDDISFVCQPQHIDQWKLFVDHYGATECLLTALRQRYSEGVIYCIDMGADLDNPQILVNALRLDSRTLTHLLTCNPPVSEVAYEEYLLWKSIGAVPDVVRLEEYFWINGFKG